MGAETSPSAAEPRLSSPATPLPADHPGVSELFSVLAAGEIAAFYRLADEAAFAPSLQGKVAFAQMATSEMGHFEILRTALEERGVDIYEAMEPYHQVLDAYHESTTPSTWLESLVKAYVGDRIAADFYCEIADMLDPQVATVVRGVLAETGHSEFVVHEVRSVVERSSTQKDRLMLWGRRLLGEAITQAQYVLAQREELAELVILASGDLSNIAALIDRMQVEHAKRMAVLGLH
ncbi:ferritin-like domain-containing protein [Rhodococcus sp. F64268]|uniref:ferritin-like fold-containing protein n=1 Tax=Rhodococcus sp. F64268 TaxID=2926402 RepID=UPI001FF2A401|nr:ferritin-like fold-containing protein [Rhodococcus sp. F64268]MCK0091074.1 ferritin-like domain-containing protein [Rhodococcus sp. F64268]